MKLLSVLFARATQQGGYASKGIHPILPHILFLALPLKYSGPVCVTQREHTYTLVCIVTPETETMV